MGIISDLPKSIRETQQGLLEKKYNCVDLVDTYLGNIKKRNKDLNALITVSEEVAYAAAKKSDKLISEMGEKAFKEFPLLGVTVVHKDIISTKNVRTTAASKVLEGYIPSYSATVVKKIEDAGAIIIGKANCDAWAHGSSGENSDFGATKNPINREYVPGGSSSGSATAVAADFSLVATATDTCGSTRLPANYCGVVGLKPTYGAISRYGVIAMASSLDSVGNITNCTTDTKLMFEVMKGEDGYDSSVLNDNLLKRDVSKDKKKFKIGLPKEFFGEGLSKEVAEGIEKAKAKFKKLGVEFKEISLPHTKYGVSVYYIIQPAEVSSNLGRYDGVRYGNGRNDFGEEAKRRIMLGTYVLSAGYHDRYYSKAMKVRTIIRGEVEKVFEEIDAILAPVAPTPPFKLGEKVDDPLKMYLTDIYAATANLSGIPSLAVPAGFTKSGLPLGFQLMGPKFGEDILFKLGEMYESA